MENYNTEQSNYGTYNTYNTNYSTNNTVLSDRKLDCFVNLYYQFIDSNDSEIFEYILKNENNDEENDVKENIIMIKKWKNENNYSSFLKFENKIYYGDINRSLNPDGFGKLMINNFNDRSFEVILGYFNGLKISGNYFQINMPYDCITHSLSNNPITIIKNSNLINDDTKKFCLSLGCNTDSLNNYEEDNQSNTFIKCWISENDAYCNLIKNFKENDFNLLSNEINSEGLEYTYFIGQKLTDKIQKGILIMNNINKGKVIYFGKINNSHFDDEDGMYLEISKKYLYKGEFKNDTFQRGKIFKNMDLDHPENIICYDYDLNSSDGMTKFERIFNNFGNEIEKGLNLYNLIIGDLVDITIDSKAEKRIFVLPEFITAITVKVIKMILNNENLDIDNTNQFSISNTNINNIKNEFTYIHENVFSIIKDLVMIDSNYEMEEQNMENETTERKYTYNSENKVNTIKDYNIKNDNQHIIKTKEIDISENIKKVIIKNYDDIRKNSEESNSNSGENSQNSDQNVNINVSDIED